MSGSVPTETVQNRALGRGLVPGPLKPAAALRGLVGLVLLVCVSQDPLWAQPVEQGDPPDPEAVQAFRNAVVEAENWWLFGDYEEIIRLLGPRLFPEPLEGLEREELISAYELLGASQFLQLGPGSARETFLELLWLEPDYAVDPFLYPPSVTNFVDELRFEFEDELNEIREARQPEEEPGTVRFIERRVEERSLLVSLIPFGVGHYANDEPVWGTLYLTTELALGATSLAMYVSNAGRVPDLEAARTRQNIQLGTGIAFFVIVAANIVHGALVHEDVVETSFGITDQPPEDFLEPESATRLFFDGRAAGAAWVLGWSGAF